MQYISLKLDTLAPATLAAIVANLSMNIAHGDETNNTALTMAAAFDQLVAIVGEDDAEAMLQEAGADPETLFEVVAA